LSRDGLVTPSTTPSYGQGCILALECDRTHPQFTSAIPDKRSIYLCTDSLKRAMRIRLSPYDIDIERMYVFKNHWNIDASRGVNHSLHKCILSLLDSLISDRGKSPKSYSWIWRSLSGMEWQAKLGIGYPIRPLRVPRRTAHIAVSHHSLLSLSTYMALTAF
jgi:hypothetical protein